MICSTFLWAIDTKSIYPQSLGLFKRSLFRPRCIIVKYALKPEIDCDWLVTKALSDGVAMVPNKFISHSTAVYDNHSL